MPLGEYKALLFGLKKTYMTKKMSWIPNLSRPMNFLLPFSEYIVYYSPLPFCQCSASGLTNPPNHSMLESERILLASSIAMLMMSPIQLCQFTLFEKFQMFLCYSFIRACFLYCTLLKYCYSCRKSYVIVKMMS